MLIYFKGQELRLWSRNDEYIILKGIKIRGKTYTATFKKSNKHYQIDSPYSWGHQEYKSRFGGDLWEPLDTTTNDIDLVVRNVDGDYVFVVDQNHLPITDIVRWSVPNPLHREVEYILEWTEPRLMAIEYVDTVLEHLLGKEQNTWSKESL